MNLSTQGTTGYSWCCIFQAFSSSRCELFALLNEMHRRLCCEDFLMHSLNELIPCRAEQVSAMGLLCLFCREKEISEHRKWFGRNYPFKLLPLWDFRDTIMASDKLFGTQPNKIKNSFPSSCLLINLPLFYPSSSGNLCWFVRFGTAEWRTRD